MAKKKIKLTRPELRRQKDALDRFTRYLPMLKLKQQQLQMMVRKINKKRREAEAAVKEAREKFERYSSVLGDVAGVDVKGLAKCREVKKSSANIAGVRIPQFEGVDFPEADYSLFATPAWVDGALWDLRDLNRKQAEFDIVEEQYNLLQRELTKVMQRVNLFEKVKIPEVREAIRVIQIHLGDEMTAGVARAKIAKNKLDTEAVASGAHGSG